MSVSVVSLVVSDARRQRLFARHIRLRRLLAYWPLATSLPLTPPAAACQTPQQLAGFVVAVRAGDQRNVHALGIGELVGIQLREHQLLGQAQVVVSPAVEGVRDSARESRAPAAGPARSSRSRNSYIRFPRSVTLQPMAIPSRSWKLAIDLRLSVTTASGRRSASGRRRPLPGVSSRRWPCPRPC